MMKMKMTKNKALWMYVAVLVVCVAAAAAQVPVVGSIVDAAIGFTLNHAAPSGQVLCGNGSVGTFATSCAANAGTATQLAATPPQCTGGLVSTGIQANGTANCTTGIARTCNANGCYIRFNDGTIHAWGNIIVSSNGSAFNSANITFPIAFTIATPVVSASVLGAPRSGAPDVPVAEPNTVSSSGSLIHMQCPIPTGGGGATFDQSVTLLWTADGY
jgi:hypothetical protein